MRKYYTRACNFYHGRIAEKLIKSKKALSLNGKKNLAFDNIEIFIRDKHKIKSKLIHFRNHLNHRFSNIPCSRNSTAALVTN